MGYVFFISEICTGRFSDIHISPETGLSDAGGASRKQRPGFIHTDGFIHLGALHQATKLRL